MEKQLSSIFSVLESMQSSLKCSICLDLLNYPVTTKCGHSFCGVCIDHTLNRSKGPGACPLCVSPMTRRSINQNKKIISLVNAVRNVISSIKADVGYDDSHKKKEPAYMEKTTIPPILLSPDNGTDLPIRRGTRKREPVVPFVAIPIDNKKRQSTKKFNISEEESSSNHILVSSKEDPFFPQNFQSFKDAEVTTITNFSNLTEKCLQVSDKEPFSNKSPASPTNNTKKKVEDWLESGLPTKLDVHLLEEDDNLIATQVFIANKTNVENDFDSKIKHNQKLIDIPSSAKVLQIQERDLFSTSQASTVIFVPDQVASNSKSLIYSYPNKDQQILEDDADGSVNFVLNNKENNNDCSLNLPANKGCKRILVETNTSENQNKKSFLHISKDCIENESILELEKKIAADGDFDPDVVLPLNLDSTRKINVSESLGKYDNQASEICYDDGSLQNPNSKGHNIRFASEIKCKLLEKSKPSRLTIRKKVRKSPGWSHIEYVKKDLRTKYPSLHIKGGEEKHSSEISKTETISTLTNMSQESIIVIEDQSQLLNQQRIDKQEETGRFKRLKKVFSFKGKTSDSNDDQSNSKGEPKRTNKTGSHSGEKNKEIGITSESKGSLMETETIDHLSKEFSKNKTFVLPIGTSIQKINDKYYSCENELCDKPKGEKEITQNQISENLQEKCGDVVAYISQVDDDILSGEANREQLSKLNESTTRFTRSKHKQKATDFIPFNGLNISRLSKTEEKINTLYKNKKKENYNYHLKRNDRNKKDKLEESLEGSVDEKFIENNVVTENIQVDIGNIQNCSRKSFDLSFNPESLKDNCCKKDAIFNDVSIETRRKLNLYGKHDENEKVSTSQVCDAAKENHVINSPQPVPFHVNGRISGGDSSYCRHSVPCEVFQMLMKFSKYVTENYTEKGSCYSKIDVPINADVTTNISVTKKMPSNIMFSNIDTSTSSRKNSLESVKFDDTCININANLDNNDKCSTINNVYPFLQNSNNKISSLSKIVSNISETVLCNNQNSISHDVSVKIISNEGSLPVSETNEFVEIIKDVAIKLPHEITGVTQREIIFSPILSPTSILNTIEENCSNKDENIISQESHFSHSILPHLDSGKSKFDSINTHKSPQTTNVNSLDFTLCQDEDGRSRNSPPVNSISGASNFENSNISPKEIDNSINSSSGSAIPIQSKNKQFNRIKIYDSSDDSCSNEDIPHWKLSSKRKRNCDSESPKSVSKDTGQCRINSEELRDFERYDENIWNYYHSSNNHTDEVRDDAAISKTFETETNCCLTNPVVDVVKNKIGFHQLNKVSEFEGNANIVANISDDEYIPGTEEVFKLAQSDLDSAKNNSKRQINNQFNGTINLASQVSISDLSTSSSVKLPLSTLKLFKNCDESLNLAEKLIQENCKPSYFDGIGQINIKNKTSNYKELTSVQCVNVAENLNEIVHSVHSSPEASSNHSIIIPSQQKRKKMQEIGTTSDKDLSLKEVEQILQKPEYKDPCNNSSFSPYKRNKIKKSCNENFSLKSHLPLTSGNQVNLDSDQESEELFQSISASVIEQEAKEKLKKSNEYSIQPFPAKTSKIIVCTGLSNLEVDKVSDFIQRVCDPSTKISNVWTKDVTHIVAKTDSEGVTDRTLKYLYGVANGIWIVSFSWIVDSLNASILLPEVEYEALDCTGYPGPKRGRNRSTPIFENCQFCLIPPFANITEAQFTELIKICGGEVVPDAYNFNEPKKGLKLVAIDSDSMLDIKVLEDVKKCGKVLMAHDWIIECVGMCALVSLSSYIFGEPTDREIKASGITEALLCETQDVI